MCHRPPHSLWGSNSIILLGYGETYFENILFSVSMDDTGRKKIKELISFCENFGLNGTCGEKSSNRLQKLPCFLLAELVFSSAGFPCLWEALWGQLKPPGSLSELANHTYLSLCPWWAERCKATIYPPAPPIQPKSINLMEGWERVWHSHQNKLISDPPIVEM